MWGTNIPARRDTINTSKKRTSKAKAKKGLLWKERELGWITPKLSLKWKIRRGLRRGGVGVGRRGEEDIGNCLFWEHERKGCNIRLIHKR
jgi:hypothetical protein